MKTLYLVPVVELPIWSNTPLSKIIDILNYACADWNSKKDTLHKDWKEHLQYFISLNGLDKIKDENSDNTFFMGFGGSHFYVHNLNGERCYVIYEKIFQF